MDGEQFHAASERILKAINTVIDGKAEAAKLAREELSERSDHDRVLRDRFEADVRNRIGDVVMNGDREQRLSHLSNISFRFIEGEGTLEPSPVIRALGVNDELARGSIRFSFGKDNTEEDVDYTVEVLSQAVERLRALSPLTLVSQ